MEPSSEGRGQSCAGISSTRELPGLYVYCVARTGEQVSLGSVGIDGSQVYTVVHNDLGAVVHECPAQPYQSDDATVVAAWFTAHHLVMEAAWKQWGTVLPLAFNTIISPQGEGSASKNLRTWLEKEYQRLKATLEALRGKAEYGVQVFWDPVLISHQVADSSPGIRRLKEEISSKPRGAAYMYHQKLESVLKKEIEARAAEAFQELYGRLSLCVDGIHIEKTKREQGRQMLMNLSCLVSTGRYPDLEAELDRLNTTKGYFVRLVGPLPPYSFC